MEPKGWRNDIEILADQAGNQGQIPGDSIRESDDKSGRAVSAEGLWEKDLPIPVRHLAAMAMIVEPAALAR
jgi:hypothetical protein